MLHSVKQLERFRVLGTDAEAGRVIDTYFDDGQWLVRYLIIEASDWLHEREVLISPYAVSSFDWVTRVIVTDLSRGQIEGSPKIDTDKPVSRQRESEYHCYYGYPEYWAPPSYWARAAAPIVAPSAELPRPSAPRRCVSDERKSTGDAHLRSTRRVIGYHIEARDAPIGHIEDFLFDDETWAIRQAVVDTRNWLPGRHVLIPPERIRSVNWAERSVSVDMPREAIRESPANVPDHPSRKAAPTNERTPS